MGAGCHCSLPEGGPGVPGAHPRTLPSLIRGVRSLQPPPHAPSPNWHRGPSLPHPQFLFFVPFPRGEGGVWSGGGCWFCCLFFLISVNDSEGVSRCRRGVFISARSGKRQVHPRKAIFFLITCQKSAAKEPRAPRPQSPAGTTGHFLYGNSSCGPAQPRQGFLLLSAILKTRNKRIFNEPPRGRVCALFGVQG